MPWQVEWHGEVSVCFVYANLFMVGLEAVFHYSADTVFEEVSIALICCCGGLFHLYQGVSVLVAKYSNVTGNPLEMALCLSKASQESSSLRIWVSQYSLGAL